MSFTEFTPIVSWKLLNERNNGCFSIDCNFCYLNKTVIGDINLYKNGDILLTYYTSIFNHPQSVSQTFSNNTVLVKVDGKTGMTLWARQSVSSYNNVLLLAIKTCILNDVAWVLLVPSVQPIPIPSILAKLDANGEVISAFYLMANNYKDISSGYILQVFQFLLLEDESVVLSLRTMSDSSNFTSTTAFNFDITYYKIDSNRDIQWGLTFDYFGKSDMLSTIVLNENTLYTGISNSLDYFCLATISLNSGKYTNSQCFYVNANNTKDRLFNLFYISNHHIYSVIIDSNYEYDCYFLIIDKNSLQISKSYKFIDKYSFFGNQIAENQYQIIFRNRRFIYSYIFGDDLNYSASLHNITWKISDTFDAGARIINSNDGNYYIAMTDMIWFEFDGIQGFETFTFKFDYNLNTFTCLDLKQIDDPDNLYIFHETLKSQYYIPGDSSFILNKAPNIIYRTDFSFYNKSAVATDEYITGDITECIWPTFYFQATNCAFNLPQFVLNNSITIPVGSNMNQTELILTPFTQCTNSLFYLEVYDANNKLSAPDWTVVDIYK